MGRRPALAKTVGNGRVRRQGPRGPCESVKVEARRLVTDEIDGRAEPTDARGAIVRLRPAPGTPEENVEEARRRWEAAGAARVVLDPTPKGKVVPTEVVAKERPSAASARQIVEALLAESNSSDPEALREVAGRIMAEEGL